MATHSLEWFHSVCNQVQRCLAITEVSAQCVNEFTHGGDGEIGVLFVRYLSSPECFAVLMGWLMMEQRSAATPLAVV